MPCRHVDCLGKLDRSLWMTLGYVDIIKMSFKLRFYEGRLLFKVRSGYM